MSTKQAASATAFAINSRTDDGEDGDADASFARVEHKHPELSAWCVLARDWLHGIPRSRANAPVSVFFKRYLVALGLPLDPSVLLARDTVLPDFYSSSLPKTTSGINSNNVVHTFLNFVLLQGFSERDEHGRSTALPQFHNPVARLSRSGVPLPAAKTIAVRTVRTMSPKGVWRHTDSTMEWVDREHPQLAEWRSLAVRWIEKDGSNMHKLTALAAFFERYIVALGLPLDPAVFLARTTILPDFRKAACPDKSGNKYGNAIHKFLAFVLMDKFHWADDKGLTAVLPAFHNPIPLLSENGGRLAPTVLGRGRDMDADLAWVQHEYPQLAAWRALAVEWLKGETLGVAIRLRSLISFFDQYLVKQGLPFDPAVFMARTTALPDFYSTSCPNSAAGIQYNNNIHAFLSFVLLHEFSVSDDFGRPVASPAFHNPVKRVSFGEHPKRDQSVFSPLPYGYIEELRQMLAAGPNFRDWPWAQSAMGTGTDWFEVAESQIKTADPDCVWRARVTKPHEGRNGQRVLEMWSPVRWVALLIKLILPFRTFQVRTLDSGEADTWRFSAGEWTLNENQHLAQGSERRPLQQGVFRRSNPMVDGDASPVVLYVNTNKTNDVRKSGTDKGYVLPWITGGAVHQDAFYWLEKLRNWQENYNPLSRRTAWKELDGRHIGAKSDVQLAGYPDACFLFRTPEAATGERHLPISTGALNTPWFALLEALELRLIGRGETHRNGTPIRFLPLLEDRIDTTTLFPLHSLRVSLITAMALDGQVPFPILQKLVGHSRLLMTLYYTKPGATHVREVLIGAAERLESRKEESIENFLLDTQHDELLKKAICNSVPALAAAIPQHPAARNPIGWMPMHHGMCLVGGATSKEESSSVGGCYNGGSRVGAGTSVMNFGPVPGGSRNCVRCRWFVTEPHYLPSLSAHFNTIAYHFDESRNVCLARESELQDLKKHKADAESSGQPYEKQADFRQAERVWESAMKRFSDLAEDIVACWRLIVRCKEALEAPPTEGTHLVAAGALADVSVVFEETNSELLQLAGVCENVEVYPDLDPGKAVFRRSQLLDGILYRDDLPPLFMLLSEKEQLLAGNAFMRRLAREMNPTNPELGRRDVIRLIDRGVSLSQHFDVDLTSLLPSDRPIPSLRNGHRLLPGDAA